MEKLISIKVLTEVSHSKRVREFSLSKDGKIKYLPGTGSVVLGPKLGDPIKDWIGDHIEPGVSVKCESDSEEAKRAMMTYVCIGNIAEIVKASRSYLVGNKGVVFGKHGGINHILIWFNEDVLEKIVPDDEIVITAEGCGLESSNEDLLLMNMSPSLFDWFKTKGLIEDSLVIPVTKRLKDVKFYSGFGSLPMMSDYDLESYPEDLRFGDIIALDGGWDKDLKYSMDNISIGVVVHGDSTSLGHGPGVVFLMCVPKKAKIEEFSDLNISDFILKLIK